MLLTAIADFFHITVDELLRGEAVAETRLIPQEQRKDIDQMVLKVGVNSAAGDRVRLNLPLPLVKLALELGMQMPEFNGMEALKNLDLNAILAMVDRGIIGKLAEVESAAGDVVEIYVE